MKQIKTILLWVGCTLFTLAYGAFVAVSLDEQIQIEKPLVVKVANK